MNFIQDAAELFFNTVASVAIILLLAVAMSYVRDAIVWLRRAGARRVRIWKLQGDIYSYDVAIAYMQKELPLDARAYALMCMRRRDANEALSALLDGKQ